MTNEPHSLQRWIAQADELLTDSQHPLDQKQATKVHLNLLREIANAQLEMQRHMTDFQLEFRNERTNTANRRVELDERIEAIEDDVKGIKELIAEYPSITWLLRYRFTPTMKAITAVLVVVYLLAQNYPRLAAWFGWAPLP